MLKEKDCRCGGFKLNDEQRKRDESNYSPQSKDLCNNQNCRHPFGKFLIVISRRRFLIDGKMHYRKTCLSSRRFD
jgi:hypothetical protein